MIKAFLLMAGVLSGLCALTGCAEEEAAIPKPHAYPRVEYPDRRYVDFDNDNCPLTFEYPDYMTVEQRTQFFGESPAHPCWFDLVAHPFNARIHCSYYPVGVEKSFDELVQDAFTMANKINQRSNYMDEILVGNARGISGLALEFTGPAASPLHFFLTDSTTHFFKASLYFNARVEPDSLAPVTEFIKVDVAHLINTLDWR